SPSRRRSECGLAGQLFSTVAALSVPGWAVPGRGLRTQWCKEPLGSKFRIAKFLKLSLVIVSASAGSQWLLLRTDLRFTPSPLSTWRRNVGKRSFTFSISNWFALASACARNVSYDDNACSYSLR